MRLQLRRLRDSDETTVAVWDEPAGRWIPLVPALGGAREFASLEPVAREVIPFLAAGAPAQELTRELLDAVRSRAASLAELADPRALRPFRPRSFRGFGLYERHLIDAARAIALQFASPPQRFVLRAYERVTGQPFPRLRPRRHFYERPGYYMGNPATFIGDGEVLEWPPTTAWLDYQAQVGFVVTRAIANATPAEARDAIGGLVALNDFTARDVQFDEAQNGIFGAFGKSKTFGVALAPTVVTADELLDRAGRLRAEVRINGELISSGTTAGAQHSPREMAAYASLGERLEPGDLLATGTPPGLSGAEHGSWLEPGDEVEVAIEGLGELRNRIGARSGAVPTAAWSSVRARP